jgi:uncharacterized protein YjbI with pentapeptide repeats
VKTTSFRQLSTSRILAIVAMIAAVGAAAYWLPGKPLKDPGELSEPTTAASSPPAGTSPIDVAKITAAATRKQAAATVHTTRTSAYASDRTGRRAARLATIAGSIALLGAWLSWLSHRETVRRNDADAENAAQERRDSRFATAIEHLAHKETAVQIGGIYTLEALANEDPDVRSETVVQILGSYTAEDRARRKAIIEKPEENFTVSPSPRHIQIAYAATARARVLRTTLDLANADLTGADLNGGDLAEADLTTADLTGADLSYADLTDADLTGADLTHANLTHAQLTGAYLTEATLTGADLTGATLKGATLSGAILAHTALIRANLADAELNSADLTGADLANTNLAGADLTEVRFTLIDDEHVGLADLEGTNLTGVFGYGTHPSHKKHLRVR